MIVKIERVATSAFHVTYTYIRVNVTCFINTLRYVIFIGRRYVYDPFREQNAHTHTHEKKKEINNNNNKINKTNILVCHGMNDD